MRKTPAPGRNSEIARKLKAAEQGSLHPQDSTRSPVQTQATARKLRRAEGIPDLPPAPQGNERKALEQLERENRRKAGTTRYRETLIRIGLGDVDTATLLIVGFSVLAMLIAPLAFIVTS